MPDAFVTPFANRLNKMCELEVVKAEKGKKIKPGTVYISPGDEHLKISRHIDQFVIDYDKSGRWDGLPTSVDSLFGSATVVCADWQVFTLTLTGMGSDGVEGLQKLRNYDNVYSVAQDEDSSVVWGMAGSAWNAGLIDKQLPLQAIAAHLISSLKSMKRD